jgi:hypothetical protein
VLADICFEKPKTTSAFNGMNIGGPLKPILVKKFEIANKMKIGSVRRERSIIFWNDLEKTL